MQGGGIAIRFTRLVEVATEEVMGLLNDPNIARHMPRNTSLSTVWTPARNWSAGLRQLMRKQHVGAT